MHILVIADNFPPEVNALASRTYEHGREWVKAGHKVTVMTCVPNFPRGKVYEGYQNRLWQTETIDGIHVVRIWSYIAANEGFTKRILDYVSYMMMAILLAPMIRKVDVVIGSSPQFFNACAAYVIAAYKRVPFVFELRDLWPESIKAVGAMKDSMWIQFLEKVELFLYQKADLIVSVTYSFKNVLIKRGIDAGKIQVVTNGVDIDRFKPMGKDTELEKQFGLEGKFVVGYIGTHGMAHALETLLEAAKLFQERLDGDRYRFLFLGDGARRSSLVEQAKKMNLPNCIFVKSVSKEEVPRYWSLLDASIIHLKKTDLFKTVIPSKMFESMGMGIPILLGVEGESADIVTQNQVGLVFEPENARQLCERITQLQIDSDLRLQLRGQCLRIAPLYERRRLAQNVLKFRVFL